MSGDDSRTAVVLIAVLAAVLLAPLLTMALAVPTMGMMGGHSGGWMAGGRGGAAPLWGVGMVLLWLAVVAGAGYVGYRAFAGPGGRGTDPALRELRVAYARGDLSDDEYERRRETLEREE